MEIKKVLFKSFITLLLLLTFSSCFRKENETVDSDNTVDYPDQESWDATLTMTNDGRRVGIVHASHYQKFSKKNKTYVSDGLKVDFFDAEGQHTSQLTSEGGEVNDLKQNMIAYGDVVVVSDSGVTLYTDTLHWDNENQKIISYIPVMIVSEEDTLYGDTFISNPSLEDYEITNSHGTGAGIFRKKR